MGEALHVDPLFVMRDIAAFSTSQWADTVVLAAAQVSTGDKERTMKSRTGNSDAEALAKTCAPNTQDE